MNEDEFWEEALPLLVAATMTGLIIAYVLWRVTP